MVPTTDAYTVIALGAVSGLASMVLLCHCLDRRQRQRRADQSESPVAAEQQRSATTEERQRLAQQQARLSEAADELEGLLGV